MEFNDVQLKEIESILCKQIHDSNGYGINNDKWQRIQAAARAIASHLSSHPSRTGGGLRWVKASERLPPDDTKRYAAHVKNMFADHLILVVIKRSGENSWIAGPIAGDYPSVSTEKIVDWLEEIQPALEQPSSSSTVGVEGPWINVAKTKPECGHCVLLWAEFVRCGKPASDMFVGYLGEHGECFTNDDEDYGWGFDECITHWMPLPPTPHESPSHAPLEGAKEEAVRFAEWIGKQLENDNLFVLSGKWFDGPGDCIAETTNALFNLYTQTLPASPTK